MLKEITKRVTYKGNILMKKGKRKNNYRVHDKSGKLYIPHTYIVAQFCP